MKTIADLKRKLTVGTKLHTYNHWFDKDMGIREIGHIQSNSFAFNTQKDGKVVLSWCMYPKSNEIIFPVNDENKFIIVNPDNKEPILTYTFV